MGTQGTFDKECRAWQEFCRAFGSDGDLPVVASLASAQDQPEGKKKRKRDPESMFKAMGAKEVDGKLILKKDDYLASPMAKRAGDEKAQARWKALAGDADQIDFDTFKTKMQEAPCQIRKEGGR